LTEPKKNTLRKNPIPQTSSGDSKSIMMKSFG
jgi:hypothetical protein